MLSYETLFLVIGLLCAIPVLMLVLMRKANKIDELEIKLMNKENAIKSLQDVIEFTQKNPIKREYGWEDKTDFQMIQDPDVSVEQYKEYLSRKVGFDSESEY